MILVIVHHYLKPGTVETAVGRLDGNGERMAQFPGYLFRYRLVSQTDPLKLSTVTGWESADAYEGWLQARRSGDPGPAFAAESPYVRTDTEVHLVERADTAMSSAG